MGSATKNSLCALYQSINQSNFYGTNIPGKARLSAMTAELVFNSKIEETVPYVGLERLLGKRSLLVTFVESEQGNQYYAACVVCILLLYMVK